MATLSLVLHKFLNGRSTRREGCVWCLFALIRAFVGEIMAREKIKIRKIDNLTARQVTFSKRRRGLFKKAQELAILCDADVAVIVFSSTGRLFEFSSSSMKEILDKHHMHFNPPKQDQPTLDLNLDSRSCSSLSQEVADKSRQLRQMRGEELQDYTIEELLQLEKTLEVGLGCVLERKGKKTMEEMNSLQQKGLQLLEDNKKLRKKARELSVGGSQVVADSENGRHEDGHPSEPITSISQSGVLQDFHGTSDTSLKLGPPCSKWK